MFNLNWMLFNVCLAVLPVLFGYFLLKSNSKILKVCFGLLWLLFLPNTIYLITDVIHFLNQWGRVDGIFKVGLVLQYVVLEIVGFVTFILALRPFEEMLVRFQVQKSNQILLLILFNFFIAFGMVLGRIERLHSWYVFTEFTSVIDAVVETMTSFEHLGLFMLFGLFCNFFYFLFRDPISHSTIKFLRNIVKY